MNSIAVQHYSLHVDLMFQYKVSQQNTSSPAYRDIQMLPNPFEPGHMHPLVQMQL